MSKAAYAFGSPGNCMRAVLHEAVIYACTCLGKCIVPWPCTRTVTGPDEKNMLRSLDSVKENYEEPCDNTVSLQIEEPLRSIFTKYSLSNELFQLTGWNSCCMANFRTPSPRNEEIPDLINCRRKHFD